MTDFSRFLRCTEVNAVCTIIPPKEPGSVKIDKRITGYVVASQPLESFSWYCGYAVFSTDILDKVFWENKIDIHGGITLYIQEGNKVILGFDCAHSYDLTFSPEGSYKSNKSFRYVIDETLNLIEQVQSILDTHESVKEGLEQAKEGKLVDLGSFAQYADLEED